MASLSIDTHDAMPGLEPKKIHVEQVEEKGSSSSSNQLTEDDLNTADWTAEEERKIVRRIDLRLLPILGSMYAISLVDRTNLGLAAVAGMNKDLELTGDRYTIIIMLFFVMYILFEIPSNLVLPRAGPANWLSFLGVSFGAVLIGMGFTQSFASMAVCRTLLGILEAGFLPGCTFLITCWYKRYEVGKRLGAFWILSVLAAGFSSIFAYVLTLLKGKQGIAGWRWIFIIEGAITTALCLFGWFIIVDFPAKAKFMSDRERHIAVERINRDRGDGDEDKISFRVILNHLSDIKLYGWAIMLLTSTLPGYAYSYFLPIILREGLGFSTTNAQLLTAPPYVVAALFTFTSSWLADRYHMRGPLIALHQALTAAGMLITTFAKGTGARLFGAYIGIAFMQFCIPGVLSYQANNIVSHSKRSVAAATCLIGGGIGGITASVAFKASEKPTYTTGVFTTLAFSIFSILIMCTFSLHFWQENKKIRLGEKVMHNIQGWYYTY